MGDIFSGDAPETKGGEPMFMFQQLPDWMQSRYKKGLKSMPTTLDLSFGGGNFPLWYKPFTSAAEALWTPHGSTPITTTPGAPSPFSSMLSTMAPWLGPTTWSSWGGLGGSLSSAGTGAGIASTTVPGALSSAGTAATTTPWWLFAA